MSLPPHFIKIKRKATDEPVDLLQVHEEHTGKRQRRTIHYVFQRQPEKSSSENEPTSDLSKSDQRTKRTQCPQTTPNLDAGAPTVKITSPGDELQDPYLQALGHVPLSKRTEAVKMAELRRTLSPSPISKKVSSGSLKKHVPRRFHMSKNSLSEPKDAVGSKKRKAQVALFVERASPAEVRDASQLQAAKAQPTKSVMEQMTAQSDSTLQSAPTPVKPTIGADTVSLQKASVKASWGDESEELVAALQEFTLQEIAKNLANKTPSASPSVTPARKKPTSRFKPKLPPQRPRQPDTLIQQAHVGEEDTSMEEDYVYETYIRIPASTVSMEESNYGIIVIEDNDLEQFYQNDESDDDDEIYDEEEDENAESHPFNDYPDEELASDDEYDVNPYQYRVYRSSDDEEFAEDEFEPDSGDEEDSIHDTRPPWMRPVGKFARQSEQALYNEFRSYCKPDDL